MIQKKESNSFNLLYVWPLNMFNISFADFSSSIKYYYDLEANFKIKKKLNIQELSKIENKLLHMNWENKVFKISL